MPRNDPNAPAKALSSFNFFVKHKSNQNVSYGFLTFAERNKKLGIEWGSLPESDKLPFIKLAMDDRLRYKKEMEVYKKSANYKNWVVAHKGTCKKDSSLKARTKSGRDTHLPIPSITDEQFKLPIFAPDFLEFNRLREAKLRSLRKQVAQIKEEIALLSKHAETLKNARSEMENRFETLECLSQRDNVHVQVFCTEMSAFIDKIRSMDGMNLASLVTESEIDQPYGHIIGNFSHLHNVSTSEENKEIMSQVGNALRTDIVSRKITSLLLTQ